jgi:hypothetical protein
MKSFIASAVLLFAVWAQSATADIIDRIDRCEDRGGANGCVYSILRELADDRQDGRDRTITYCECVASTNDCSGSSSSGSPARRLSVRLVANIEDLSSGSIISSRRISCWDSHESFDAPVPRACQVAMSQNVRCNVSQR